MGAGLPEITELLAGHNPEINGLSSLVRNYPQFSTVLARVVEKKICSANSKKSFKVRSK